MNVRWFVLIWFITGCSQATENPNAENKPKPKQLAVSPTLTIQIQPFVGFPNELLKKTVTSLKKVCPALVVKDGIPLPRTAYYKARRRYRADSLLNRLSELTPPGMVTIGFVTDDISATKGKYNDWGVMGLGRCPGNTCVVSIYRLSKNERMSLFYKLALHELGHTQGLPHCLEQTCFMRDADGGNPMREETAFCAKCGLKLEQLGWNIKGSEH